MNETPLIYSAPMVHAKLAGRKTETRRLVKWPQVPEGHDEDYNPSKIITGWPFLHWNPGNGRDRFTPLRCPYGEPGDQIWGRENYHIRSWSQRSGLFTLEGYYLADQREFSIELTAEESLKFAAWKRTTGNFPSIYLFRSLARIRDTLISVRAHRIQEITDKEILAEGLLTPVGTPLRQSFIILWDKLNAPRGGSFAANPYVWALTSTPVH
jgi:hypothetical protein